MDDMMARTEGERYEVRDWISSGSVYKVVDFLQQHLKGLAPRRERQVAGLVQS